MPKAEKQQQHAKAAPSSSRAATPKLYRSMGQIRRAFYPDGEKRSEREATGKHTHVIGFPARDASLEEGGSLHA
jgi:hypothetical protein